MNYRSTQLLIFLLLIVASICQAYGVIASPIVVHVELTIIFALITLITIEQVTIHNHPFNIMIKPFTQRWRQTLPWLMRIGVRSQPYGLCLNLSNHPIDYTLVPGLEPVFNFKYQNCYIRGFQKLYCSMLIEISHDENNMIALHQLFRELRKSGIKFKNIHFLISQTQLINLGDYLQKDWALLTPILSSVKQNHLILYNQDLHQDLYFCCEYGECNIPLFSFPNSTDNTIRQSINTQYSEFIQSLMAQLNELTLVAQSNSSVSQNLFTLPHTLSKLKYNLLNAIEYCNEAKLNICSFGLGLFHTQPPSLCYDRWNITQRLKQLFFMLLCTLVIINLNNYHTTYKQKIELNRYDAQEVIYPMIKNSSKYTPHKTHLKRSLSAWSKELTSEERDVAGLLLSASNSNHLSHAQKEIIKYMGIKLNEEEASQLSLLWRQVATAPSKINLRTLAHFIEPSEITNICQIIEGYNYTQCHSTLKDDLSYIKVKNKIDYISKTLLPVDPENAMQAHKQLAYITKNQSVIGQNIREELYSLEHKISNHNLEELRTSLEQLSDILNLLQANEGIVLLNRLKDFFKESSHIETPSQAFNYIKSSYSIHDHTANTVQSALSNLNPYQQQWFNKYINYERHRIETLAIQHITGQWKDIEHSINVIRHQFPFDKNAQTNCNESEITQLYATSGIINKFYKNHLETFINIDLDKNKANNKLLSIPVPDNIISTIMHAKVLNAALISSKENILQNWGIKLMQPQHPIESVTLITNKNKQRLSEHKLTTLHWTPGDFISLEIQLTDKRIINYSYSDYWSFISFLRGLKQTNKKTYTINDPKNQWVLNLEMHPNHPISINNERIFMLPNSSWTE